MKADEYNDNIDKFLKKRIKQIPAESPGEDFVKNVMLKVNELDEKNVIVYKPLISKTIWFILSFVLIVLYGFILTLNSYEIDFSNLNNILDNFTYKYLSDILNPIFITAIIIFVFYFIIEIILIRRKYDEITEIL